MFFSNTQNNEKVFFQSSDAETHSAAEQDGTRSYSKCPQESRPDASHASVPRLGILTGTLQNAEQKVRYCNTFDTDVQHVRDRGLGNFPSLCRSRINQNSSETNLFAAIGLPELECWPRGRRERACCSQALRQKEQWKGKPLARKSGTSPKIGFNIESKWLYIRIQGG